mmetsp:Transcript_121362/g.302852  ORF Transcript_121362/g.302852 Transcript_121362/m.302852 type:complete len:82 (-) Transcript_121362:207-452(-)
MAEDKCAADESAAGRDFFDITMTPLDLSFTFSISAAHRQGFAAALGWPWLPSCFRTSEADPWFSSASAAASYTVTGHSPTS